MCGGSQNDIVGVAKSGDRGRPVDLATVVVAGKSRADGRAHGDARGVVTELAGHEAQ